MSAFYRANAFAARQLARVLGSPVRLEGFHHVPAEGPFILVANHQSFLDPIFLQGFCPRELHSMTKSTQFASPILRRWMQRLHAYPVRRYRIDPQAVRVTLRTLASGEAVCIYVEGERSWDGRLQPPRLGALRLILKAGVPVVPAAITGCYEILPRWAHGLRRNPLRIAFGPALRFPQLDDRRARQDALPDTQRRVLEALRRLLEPTERPHAGDPGPGKGTTVSGNVAEAGAGRRNRAVDS